MQIEEPVAQWQKNAGEPCTKESDAVRPPIYDAGKITALCDLFPGLTRERMITDLLAASLDELATSFSYQPGDEIAAYDEQALTPCFQSLAKAYAQTLSPVDR